MNENGLHLPDPYFLLAFLNLLPSLLTRFKDDTNDTDWQGWF